MSSVIKKTTSRCVLVRLNFNSLFFFQKEKEVLVQADLAGKMWEKFGYNKLFVLFMFERAHVRVGQLIFMWMIV